MSAPSTGPPARVVAALRCPVCRGGLTGSTNALRCARRHTADVARQGYVNLLPGGAGRAGSADSAEMVGARADFLSAGHYAPLVTAVADEAATEAPELVVDAGAGTGYYASAVLERLPTAVGVAGDLSKFAMRRAARAHPRLGAVVCDVWAELPLHDGVAGLVLNVFAPRNGPEFARVLGPGGRLIVVTPAAEHLRELIDPLGLLSVDAAKPERLERSLGPAFRLLWRRDCTYRMTLPAADVERLVLMGPSGYHLDRNELTERLGELAEPTTVTAAFVISGYLRVEDKHAGPSERAGT